MMQKEAELHWRQSLGGLPIRYPTNDERGGYDQYVPQNAVQMFVD